ncbi:MAG TPA: hypothetical protein VMG34_00430 [Bacteroidota bacterium]|nr:hypothetical protein [Bacteroidota bacterium]
MPRFGWLPFNIAGEVVMDDPMKTALDKFNDEFMFILYKGREHIVARKEFARVFSILIPKYFVPMQKEDAETPHGPQQ